MFLNRRSKLNVLLIGLIFSGCASFEPGLRFQDLMRARQPTVKEAQGGLEVSIEEFVSAQKSNQAFDADIARYGVLPLLVRVENTGTETYRVPQHAITVFLNSQPLGLLSGEQAASQAATSEYAGKALAWTVATGPFFILLWPATIAGSAAHTASVNRRIQQHFESLQFTDALLKPNQTGAGFLYFKLPDGTKRLEKLSIQIEPSEEKSGKRLSFKLSLPTLELSAPASTRVGEVTEAPTQPRLTRVTDPMRRIEFPGFSILPPRGENWFTAENPEVAGGPEVVVLFYKRLRDTLPESPPEAHTVAATVMILYLKDMRFESPTAFLDFVKREFEIGTGIKINPRHRLVASNVSLDTSLGTHCVKYDHTVEDSGVPEFPGFIFILSAGGFRCLHPNYPNYLIDVGYSERYLKGEQPILVETEVEPFLKSLMMFSATGRPPAGRPR